MEPNIKEERWNKGQAAFGSRMNADGDIAFLDTEEQAEALRKRVGGDRVAESYDGNKFSVIKEGDRFNYFYTKSGKWWSIRLQQFLNDDGTGSDIQQGIAVEAEHADLVQWLREYSVANNGQFPPDTEIFAKIAEKHLAEDPEYYKKLAKMEGDRTNASNDQEEREFALAIMLGGQEISSEDLGGGREAKVYSYKGKKYSIVVAGGKPTTPAESLNAVSTDQDRRDAGAAEWGSK